MSISLYPHNQAAYVSAVTMLSEHKKAAIIHPTGTGKSFIAFKLCADNPDKRICWLSPSEYIFRTQLENLQKASGGYVPENIAFFTYAKLMNMSDDEIKDVRPDYIILDEFHRCGAEMWGIGVQTLLSRYPESPILGLSATAIRYLDNQRDMSDELFSGNVASEMTLGEAIVRGILNPPKYVLSLFPYQKDLEKYEKRIAKQKNRLVRDEGQKQLEALRRALEQADGMDEIFSKHMTDKQGKYIVFCANYEHMREMISVSKEWFSKIDKNPHIYPAYSNDPGTSRAFADFKADSGEHLKLLYCIDMLNEGIHIDDISGVILLRPTMSPIIYKQQIGRALSANKTNNSIIFDVVLNIENLTAIGAIEEEMEQIVSYYRAHGQADEIVNEHFRIVDEVRDCMELFERLNETLTASWDSMYALAADYFEEFGDINIPKRYVTPEGYALGAWLSTQKRVYQGKVAGTLSQARIRKLEKLGMRWENSLDAHWEENFSAAHAYFEEYGNLLVPAKESYHGIALGKWISNLRACRKGGNRDGCLTEERIQSLDDIGMVWNVPEYLFEKNFSAALEYYHEYGNLNVPHYYVTDDGIKLGAWISNLRSAERSGSKSKRAEITDEQRARLSEIGMVWGGRYETAWENTYAKAVKYKEIYGNLNIPVAYVTEDGCRLGKWIRKQRDGFDTTLSAYRREKLELLGMNAST